MIKDFFNAPKRNGMSLVDRDASDSKTNQGQDSTLASTCGSKAQLVNQNSDLKGHNSQDNSDQNCCAQSSGPRDKSNAYSPQSHCSHFSFSKTLDVSREHVCGYNPNLDASFENKILPPGALDLAHTDLLSLTFVTPQITFEELYLSQEQQLFFNKIVTSHRNADKLASLGLDPVMRILLIGEHGTGRTSVCYALASELEMPLAFIHLEYLAAMLVSQAILKLNQLLTEINDVAQKAPQGLMLVLENLEQAYAHDLSVSCSPLMYHLVSIIDKLPANVFLGVTSDTTFGGDGRLKHLFDDVITMELPVLSQREDIIQAFIERYRLPPVLSPELLAKFTEGIGYGELKNIMTDAARLHVLNDDLTNTDVATIILRRLTEYGSTQLKNIKVVATLLDRGVTLRTAAAALGVSHSTLEYQVQKYRASLEFNSNN